MGRGVWVECRRGRAEGDVSSCGGWAVGGLVVFRRSLRDEMILSSSRIGGPSKIYVMFNFSNGVSARPDSERRQLHET